MNETVKDIKEIGGTSSEIEKQTGIKKGDVVLWIEGGSAYGHGNLVSGVVSKVDIIEIKEGDRRSVLWINEDEGYRGVEDVYTREQIDSLFDNPIFGKEVKK